MEAKGLTCDQISNEPVHIIAVDPVNEGEEIIGPVHHDTGSRQHVAEPFSRRRFVFDKSVGCGCGEDGFACGKLLLAPWIAILQFNAQNLCEAMANFVGRTRHVGF